MSIKSVREPTKEEQKNLVPAIIGLSLAFAVGTLAIYFMFFNKDVGECLYQEANFWTQKSVAQHNLIIKMFEHIFKRDYMKSKLEGIGISALLSLTIDIVVGIPYALYLNTLQEERLSR